MLGINASETENHIVAKHFSNEALRLFCALKVFIVTFE